jgi:hypothetical protein
MRISLSMLRWLSAGILALVTLAVLLLAAVPAYADTGTYKINEYIVTLEPRNDGRVLITVAQQWEVLSGSIPWVTVGLPNRYFEIQSSGAAVRSASDGSGGGFYGVRLDLDKDYQPGQIFNVTFTVLQSHILERLTDQNMWRIDFQPGWYDSASIGYLEVRIISPVDYGSYSNVNPPPVVKGNIITWAKTNMSPGQRLDIKVESVDGSFLTATEPAVSSGFKLGTGFWVFVIILVLVGLMIVWRISAGRKEREAYIRSKATAIEDEMAKNPDKKKEIEDKFKEHLANDNLQADAQGRYYDRGFGGYVSPAIWWAILASPNRSFFGTPNSGNTTPPVHHTNPGCVHSCACVSCACACACACAGGGAAGCSRKTLHEFRKNQTKEVSTKS